MTQEEKARAYDEALEKATTYYDNAKVAGDYSAVARYENIFPELCESEDERIRKTILTKMRACQKQSNFFSNDEIAYLEKQKEQKLELCDMGRWDEESYNNGIHHVLQNPEAYGLSKKKPVECLKVERDGWYVCIKDYYCGGRKRSSVGDLVQAKGGMHIMGEKDISEWFRRAYYEEVRNAFGPNTDTNISEQKPAEKQDYTGLTDLERAIHRGFLSVGVENVPVTIIKETAQDCLAQIKPVEWSDTNELVFKDICKHLKEEGYNGWVVLLKALHDGKFKQPVAEWSEEDEKQIAQIERICKNAGCSKVLQEKIHNWFDSFCFKMVKWDTDMMSIRNSIRDILYKEKRCPNTWFTYLEHCGPQTKYAYWKPSEEQMKALQNAVALTACDKELARLYNQLKRIKED